ncbi:MAG TPA: GAF domain-containing protein [Candidatus Sulfotelmatobacter sp.]|jgi:GAF domain-containing protein
MADRTNREQFKSIATTGGLWAGLQWLNSRAPYRFSAVFAFDGDMLRNVCLVDKEDADVKTCGDQPILNSYCTYIHRSGQPFSVENSNLDSRVADHPKRPSLQSYYGIPLVDPDGKMLGTVCHFDAAAVPVNADAADVLDDLAPLITEMAFHQ